MSHNKSKHSKLTQAVASLLALVLMLVWMEGGFNHKIPPGLQAAETGRAAIGTTAIVQAQQFDEIRRWPATVSARSVVQVSPKISARILTLPLQAGDGVKAGMIVATLDATELKSRVDQARSALAAVQAEATKAALELRRMQNLYGKEAATLQSLEAAQAAARSSEAQVAQARAAIATAESLLAETVVKSPFEGTVVKRNQEPGDLAQPGVSIVTLQSSQKMRVEVAIPEECARSIVLGQSLKAQLEGQSRSVKVEEIAPAADPQTRTVLIKASLDGPAQPGAYAWVEQSCGQRSVLLIPANAVSRSGQLESVRVVEEGIAKLRHIRTGKIYAGQVEVLSGLKVGDKVVVGGGL